METVQAQLEVCGCDSVSGPRAEPYPHLANLILWGDNSVLFLNMWKLGLRAVG